MSQRGGSRAAERSRQARQVAVYLTAKQLGQLADLMLLGEARELATEMRKCARALLRLLDANADARRFPSAKVFDLHGRLRRRAILAALGASPDPRPPPRAA